MPKTKKSSSPAPSLVPNSNVPLLYDISAAAELLGIPSWSLRRLIWRKEIPAAKINNKIYLARTTVLGFAERIAGGVQ
jgi:hypothetical protein